MQIRKIFIFHSAHQLWDDELSKEENLELYGKCTYLHGHSYTLTVIVEGDVAPSGMVMNFRDVKKVVKKHILDRYDHAFLNELPEYKNVPTTCENMLLEMFKVLSKEFECYEGVVLAELRLKETATSEGIIKRSK